MATRLCRMLHKYLLIIDESFPLKYMNLILFLLVSMKLKKSWALKWGKIFILRRAQKRVKSFYFMTWISHFHQRLKFRFLVKHLHYLWHIHLLRLAGVFLVLFAHLNFEILQWEYFIWHFIRFASTVAGEGWLSLFIHHLCGGDLSNLTSCTVERSACDLTIRKLNLK